MASRDFQINILANADQAGRTVDRFGAKLSNLDKAKLAAGAAAGGIMAAGLSQIGPAIDEASRLEQSIGGVGAVFGSQADEIDKSAREAAGAIGLSRTEYQELATVLGAGLKNKGIKDFAGESQNLVAIGGDLSAMYGGTTKEAVEALSSAMRGESDPIERYGVALNETAVNAELAASGAKKAEGGYTEQQKTMARLAIITKQTADAQGAAGREAGTTASRQQQLQAHVANLRAELGTNLLPILASLLGKLAEWGQWLSDNPGKAQALVIAIGGLAVAMGIFSAASTISAGASSIAALATSGFAASIGSATLAAAPWIIAVAAIAGGAYLIYRNWGGISAWFGKEWSGVKGGAGDVVSWLRSNWGLVAGILTGPFGLAEVSVTRNWGRVKNLFTNFDSWLSGKMSGVGSTITGTFREPLNWVGDRVGWVERKFESFVTFWENLPGTIRKDGSRLANASIGALNSIIDAWNKLDFSIDIELPTWLGGASFKVADMIPDVSRIPALAKGGIAMAPTVALIGEAGPEAVVPLDRGREFGLGGPGVADVHVTVQVDGQTLLRALRRAELRSA